LANGNRVDVQCRGDEGLPPRLVMPTKVRIHVFKRGPGKQTWMPDLRQHDNTAAWHHVIPIRLKLL
jgi:hypothetical protein